MGVNQNVQVTVMEVGIARKRIALSMKSDPFAERGKDSKSRTTSNPPSKPQKAEEPQGTMAEKLAMLKGKFGK